MGGGGGGYGSEGFGSQPVAEGALSVRERHGAFMEHCRTSESVED